MGADNRPGTALALAGSTARRRNGRGAREPMAFHDVAGAVALAEDTGYASVWVPDHGVWDPFALLAAMAPRTDRIGLATGVVTLSARRPAGIAAGALTVDRVSAGRGLVGGGGGPERRAAPGGRGPQGA